MSQGYMRAEAASSPGRRRKRDTSAINAPREFPQAQRGSFRPPDLSGRADRCYETTAALGLRANRCMTDLPKPLRLPPACSMMGARGQMLARCPSAAMERRNARDRRSALSLPPRMPGQLPRCIRSYDAPGSRSEGGRGRPPHGHAWRTAGRSQANYACLSVR